MAHVLLIFPYPSEEQTTHISPALSILYIGSFLEKAGVSVSYLDMRQHTTEHLRQEIDKGPLAVGISTMTGFQLSESLNIIKILRERAPKVPVVLGGVHPSLLPEQALADPDVDFVVIGEGEYTMLELVEALDSKVKDFGKIKGLGWKRASGEPVINEKRPFMDMALSVPPVTKSSAPLYLRYPLAKIQVARGCPFRCGFCYNTVFNNRKYREKPLEIIEEEIRTVMAFAPHAKHISLLADEIGFNHKRVVSIAELAAKYGSSFHTSIRAENVDEALVEAIGEHCEELRIGVEHVAPRIRKLIKKDNTVDHVIAASKAIARSSIRPVWSFMTAFPEETREETVANMDFADMLREQNPRSVITPFFILTPYPGTELFTIALQYGYTPPQSLKDWGNFGLGKVNMPWIDMETQRFTDLYGITSILNVNAEAYRGDEFEEKFFAHIRSLAAERWQKRDLNFREEWALFLSYNRRQRSMNASA